MNNNAYGLDEFNTICIDRVASTILTLLDCPVANGMAEPIPQVLDAAQAKFERHPDKNTKRGATCDRVFMYNPDAIGQWIYGKYFAKHFYRAEKLSDLKLNMLSVIPPKTPVCFGSMYSGLQPSVHGIQSYTKPVLKCRTIFDQIIEGKKKVAIVSTQGDSISLIFLERKMDYFIYKTVAECNQKAAELIEKDEYDCIVLYNTDYDYWMHRNTPTGPLARKAIQQDINEFETLYNLIKEKWGGKHKTALCFAPDHGCHRWLGVLGQHEFNKPCDMNINHLWSFIN